MKAKSARARRARKEPDPQEGPARLSESEKLSWLRFRGGKGVATYIGVITALYWPAGAFFCAVWLGIAVVTRYSSLSALIAAAFTPIFVAVLAPGALYVFMLALSVILIARHHKNIRNLISGHESKIGQTAAGAKRA